ncbi:Uncharacterised protein [Escherichia coli]|uniref:hypothetical protein n=1 Tax=Escherichia coli TaxID=562 RepID=UPI0006A1CA19|nr:hypothetical protein [Escherichia coli]CTR30182.1 Uncharacterised protein [Escherichia coli]
MKNKTTTTINQNEKSITVKEVNAMSFKETHYDGQDHDKIRAQKDFKKAMDEKVNEILDSLPEVIRPIISQAADELDSIVPSVLRVPDSVTHDKIDRQAIYMRLLFAVANKLGHGCQWLK